MKYYLVTWTATTSEGEEFSGNATMKWDGESPSDKTIIEIIKSSDSKLKDQQLTLQDKLEFDSQEDLDNYGLS